MPTRKKRSLIRGNKIFLGGAPPMRKPVIDRNVPVEYETYLLGKRATEDDWLPDAHDDACHPDEIGDVAAVVAFLDGVLGEVGDRDEGGEDASATDRAGAAGEEPQS